MSNQNSWTDDLDVLLAQYIDLLNEHGPRGAAVNAFIKQNGANAALMRLVKAAREVQSLYHEGYLRK